MLRISQINNTYVLLKYLITVTSGYISHSDAIYDMETGTLIQEAVKGMYFYLDENSQIAVDTEEERDNILAQVTATYETLTLTTQQDERLAEVQNSGASLDDVKYYIEYGTFPEGKHSLLVLQNQKQQAMINDLQLALAELMGV